MLKYISIILISVIGLMPCINCLAQYHYNGDAENQTENYLLDYYTQVFGFDVKEIQNPLLFDMVDQWLGTPYKFSGTCEGGIDCSRFTITVYASAFNKVIEGSSAELFEQCERVKKNGLQQGDMVFFKIGSRRISHVGIYLGENKFAHATTKVGVVINDLDEPYYHKYFYSGGRIK